MTTNSASGANAANGAGTGTDKPPVSSPSSLANEETFLQLLVSQIKNQDPLNPSDGVQFLTQLAQFTSLEQQLQMNSQLTDIKNELANLSPASTP